MNKLNRNDLCWCGSGKKYKKCHMLQDEASGTGPLSFPVVPKVTAGGVTKGRVSPPRTVPAHIPRPDYVAGGGGDNPAMRQVRLSDSEIEQMRKTCQAARRVLDRALQAVRPGVTTDALDEIVHEACIAEGGYPSPLNYHGFPKSACTSVNEVICHGIPDDRPLVEGDIVNVDVTLFLNGVHGDCSETVAVGKIDSASEQLMQVTHEALMRAIKAVKPGGLIRDIGNVIEPYVKGFGYSVVRDYCGHGIGTQFHADPTVPHFANSKGKTRIEPGMVFTIEPMINMGVWKQVLWEDNWTVVTADLKRSAQYEHTVLVTQNGVEILTQR